jgi:hypothetical protein
LILPVWAADEAVSTAFWAEFLDGTTERLSLREIAEGRLAVDDSSGRTISLNDLIGLRRADSRTKPVFASPEVWLTSGDRWRVVPIEADDEVLAVRWGDDPKAEPIRIPLERIAGILLRTPASASKRDALYRAMAREPQRSDVAWLASGDRVFGEFMRFDGKSLQFDSDAGKLAVSREQLLALRFNPELVAVDQPISPRYALTFSDGSRITATTFATTAEGVTFTTVFGATGELPLESLIDVRVYSKRIQPLSERKPERFEHTPYLGGERVWVKDRNASYGPLSLRGREYATGLGTYSSMTITYALEPSDREFRAVVGIDDCANGGGDAVFSIDVDDRRVWESPHVTGTTPPLTVPPIDLRKGKRLSLRVDFGEMGDVADYADWCDAIVIRDQ